MPKMWPGGVSVIPFQRQRLLTWLERQGPRDPSGQRRPNTTVRRVAQRPDLAATRIDGGSSAHVSAVHQNDVATLLG
jgi:hypothetical protein